MPLRSNRFTGFIVLLASFALVSVAGSVFYYVNLQQNESFQTQLHLRELQRTAISLEQSIASIKKSIEIDVESGRSEEDSGSPRIEPDDGIGCSRPHEFCALKDHLITAFPHLVAEPAQPENENSAPQCPWQNHSLAIVAGTIDACAVEEQATLISRNFYSSPRKKSFPCKAPDSREGNANAAGDDISTICPLASRYISRIKIPLSDLASPSTLMPLVILTDDDGSRIHTWENVQNHATQSGIRYRSAAALLQQVRIKQTRKSADENSSDIDSIGYSDFVDTEIAGERYRAYVMPWRKVPYFAEDCDGPDCEQTDEGSSDYYLIGLQPYSSLLGSKLSVSHSIVVMLVLAVLLLLALLPVIKLQLVSPQQAFTSPDRQALVLGAVLFMALLVISSFHFILYSGLKDQLDAQANSIHRQISESFRKEVRTWRNLAEATWRSPTRVNGADSSARPDSVSECGAGPDFLLAPSAFREDTFIEGTFILGQDGKFEVGGWSHARHCRPNASTRLTHRSYYKHGMACTGWSIDAPESSAAESECAGKAFIERVLNVRDSRLNTWLSLPLFDEPDVAGSSVGEDRQLLVFGGRLQTFIKPVLPMHFTYLVFDNQTGTVQYHSVDNVSSLVDNVFVDTDNNNTLNSLIRLNHTTPQTFSGLYKGQEYRFSAGRMIQTVPWTLLVMYEKAPLRNINMLSVLTTLLLVIGLIMLAWVCCRTLPGDWQRGLFLPLQFDRSRRTRDYLFGAGILLLLFFLALALVLWSHRPGIVLPGIAATALFLVGFRRQRATQQGRDAGRSFRRKPEPRKSAAYTLYILMLLANLVALPALLVSEQSHRFFLSQHTALMSFDITGKINAAKRERRHYVDSFIDAEDKSLHDARERHLNADRVRCYLGERSDDHPSLASDCGSGDFTTQAFSYADELVRMLSHAPLPMEGASLVEKLWQHMNLRLDATSDFEVLAQTRRSDSSSAGVTTPVYRFSPDLPGLYRAIWVDRPLWFLIAALLIGLLPYWLFRTRVLPNLFGLQLPDYYRTPSPAWTDGAERKEDAGNNRDVAEGLRRLLENYRRSDQEPLYIQVIRPGVQTRSLFSDVTATQVRAQGAPEAAQEPDKPGARLKLLTSSPVDLNLLAAEPFSSPQEALSTYLDATPSEGLGTLALRGFEHIPLNPVKRRNALQLLQYLLAERSINLILLVDISPLYRFTRLEAYPYKLVPEALPDSEEQIAWAALFRRFTKIYDWEPALRHGSPGKGAWQAFLQEYHGWPELQRVAREFLAYHCVEKDPEFSVELALHELKPVTESSNRDAGDVRSRCSELADSIDQHWTPAQVVEFFGIASVAHYRYRWELCTTQERLLLIQLAHNNTPNPRNTLPIRHLLRRGYLYHQEGWRLANDSFRNFVLHAENPVVVQSWIGDANESLWKYVKIPIFILLLSLLGLLAYTAAEAFHSFLGIAAAILGLIPVLLRNISLIRNQANADG